MDEECKNVVESAWASRENNIEARAVADRLADCAVYMDKWGFQKYGKMGSEIAILQKEIEAKKSDCLFAPCIREISNMEKQLEELHARDEIYWKQRSRMEWLAHGDRNSKKFHLKASERKRKNAIKGHFNSSGEWCTSLDDILDISSRYFQNIFSSSTPSMSDLDLVMSYVRPRVTREMNLYGWNKTLITLIPKVKEPKNVKDFRSISLCTILYKIVSRSITNCFRLILDNVIGESQSAFIPGRLITDNVLIGFEAMHWIRQHRGGKTGYMALKLDMSKAYDRVEWTFLKEMMLRLGFDNGWVELVMRCVSSVSYSFILNGQVQGALTPNRGIRQGDPLSPYLFVICAHGFFELLIDFERKKLFKGVKIATSCPSITHLFCVCI
ncbi:hypothetical protein UlMin_039349 [Ulmus minor]